MFCIALTNEWILYILLLRLSGKHGEVNCLYDIGLMLLEFGMKLVVCEARLTLVWYYVRLGFG